MAAQGRALPDLIARLKLETTEATKDAAQAGQQIGKEITKGANNATAAVRRMTSASAEAHLSISRLGLGMASTAASVAGGIVAYSGLSNAFGFVTGAIRDSISAGVSYQDEMNTLKAVSGATTAQMAALGKRAIDLGNDLSLPSTSAKDAATAMTELVKGGLSVQDAMDAAKGVLQLAAAATVDEGTAATFTADALNAFHLKGTDAVKVADLLAGAANASSGEITDMALSLQQSAAVFAAAHVPIQTTVALIAELANNGIRGSDAGTSLKTMMLALQTPTDTQAALMKKLNISLYDAQGNMRDFRDIIKDAQGPLSKLTQAQRDQALGTIFGSDAVRAANIVFGSGAEALDKMTAAVSRSNSAADVAAAKSQGLGGAWRGLQSQIETLELEMEQKASPALEGFIRGISDALPKAADVAQRGLEGLAGQVQKLASEAAPTAKQATDTVGGWKDEFVKNVGDAVKQSGPQFDALKRDFSDLEEEMGKFGKSEAFAHIVATFTVLLPSAMRPTIAGLQLMIDQTRIMTTAIFGAVQVIWDLYHGDWKKAWEDASATVQTQTENVKRYAADGNEFLIASQKATSGDVLAEYNRMKDQTLVAMNGIKQNELAVAQETRIAMGVHAHEAGEVYSAGMEEGIRAGGTRIAGAAVESVTDAVALAREEAKGGYGVGAFLAQGMALGLADNSGFLSSAAAAATRNAIKEAKNAAAVSAAGISAGGGGAGLASGGIIPGYAPGHDSVPAMLSPGEAVLRPEAARVLGPQMINRLNAIRFADGGPVPSSAPAQPASVTVNIYGAGLNPEQIAMSVDRRLSRLLLAT